MFSTILSAATWRRMLLLGITTLIAMLAVSFSAPQDAHAIRDPTIVTSGQVGWVKTRSTIHCMAMTPGCLAPGTHQAWRWNGSSWQSARVLENTDVYVYPYSAPWHWIWTQQTGWLAIQNSALTTGYSCLGINCPIF